MERIWLKVEGFQLCDLCRAKEKRSAWATVRVGEKSFAVRGYSFKLENDGHITQSSGTNMRFSDTPYLHKGKRKPGLLLDEFLGQVIYDRYLNQYAKENEELRVFLEGKTELKEFPFFKPAEWGARSLRIPVDFVALWSMASSMLSNGSVYANIQLGEHLVFWEQLIFDLKEFHYGGSGPVRDHRDAIYDERAISAINYLLSRKKLQNRIRHLSETRGMEFSDSVYFEKAPGYDEKRITERKLPRSVPRPVRLY